MKGSSKEYVKAAGSDPANPLGLVTTTSAFPTAWAGTIAVIVVLLTTVTLTTAISTLTVAPVTKPVPLITTGVGRAVEPVDGEIAVTVGAVGTVGGGGGVGPDGDRPSQAATALASANSNSPIWMRGVRVIFFSESGSEGAALSEDDWPSLPRRSWVIAVALYLEKREPEIKTRILGKASKMVPLRHTPPTSPDCCSSGARGTRLPSTA